MSRGSFVLFVTLCLLCPPSTHAHDLINHGIVTADGEAGEKYANGTGLDVNIGVLIFAVAGAPKCRLSWPDNTRDTSDSLVVHATLAKNQSMSVEMPGGGGRCAWAIWMLNDTGNTTSTAPH